MLDVAFLTISESCFMFGSGGLMTIASGFILPKYQFVTILSFKLLSWKHSGSSQYSAPHIALRHLV